MEKTTMKYLVDQGHIFMGGAVSDENPKICETLEYAEHYYNSIDLDSTLEFPVYKALFKIEVDEEDGEILDHIFIKQETTEKEDI